MRKIYVISRIAGGQIQLRNEAGVCWTIPVDDAPVAALVGDSLSCDLTMKDWRFHNEPLPVPDFLREQEETNQQIRAEHAAALVPEVAPVESDQRVAEIILEIKEHQAAIKRLKKEAEFFGFAV